jgi:DNA-binding CsgD family transcriptional regulator
MRDAAILHVLECLRVGAAIFDDAGQILEHNATYASNLRQLGRSPIDNMAQIEALTRPCAKSRLRVGADWIHILETNTGCPLVLHCLGDAEEGRNTCSHVVLLVALDHYPMPKRSTLRHVFGLSPAEANVGKLLSGGLSVAQIAVRTQTTEHTVRVHLKHIFQKTNTSSQGTLTHILRRCSLLPSLARAQHESVRIS